MLTRLTRLFPLWALLFSACAYTLPDLFTPARGWIVPLLMLVMLGMGLTLRPADFRPVLRQPRLLAMGTGLQFLVMPLAALAVARGLNMTPEQTVGMVLVGASSGGTASNVMVYLARGNVALSIALTAVSTLLAVVLTPLLTLLLAGATVPVPAGDMLMTVAQVALGPVLLGMLLRYWLAERLARIEQMLPLGSMCAICLIIAIIVALNRDHLATAGPLVVLAVVLHNGFGLAAGYGLARMLRADQVSARTIALEVGMQNSGLAVALAIQFFTPAAALPGALFSVWHNLSGSVLAAVWTRRQIKRPRPR